MGGRGVERMERVEGQSTTAKGKGSARLLRLVGTQHGYSADEPMHCSRRCLAKMDLRVSRRKAKRTGAHRAGGRGGGRGADEGGIRRSGSGRMGTVVSIAVLAALRGIRPAAGACTELDLPDVSIEIVPTECSFWRQAGIIRAHGSDAVDDMTIKWERDCGVPIGHREIRFSGPGEGQMGVDEWLEVHAVFAGVHIYICACPGCLSLAFSDSSPRRMCGCGTCRKQG